MEDFDEPYIHVPAKDHYEHGHKRGNEHHFIERHEKAHPHAGEFKTKVRWGDKHGGYGEHYWDYNHDGHGNDGNGEESQNNEEYAPYQEEAESQPSPSYNKEGLRGKRQPNPNDDVEFISDEARSLISEGNTRRHGGNYRQAKDYRGKREDADTIYGQNLVFVPGSGNIVDQQTGIEYELKKIDS